MTDEELDDKIKELEEEFKELPHPTYHPIQFGHKLKLLEFYKKRRKKDLTLIKD